MPSTAVSDWEEMELLVTVKAYPSVSVKYGEAVCVAGVRLDGPVPEWVRLFPVGFRGLPREQQFRKWQRVRLRAQRHSTDRRRESYRPDVDSFRLGEVLPAGGCWPARRPLVERLEGPTMCELYRGRRGGGDGPSLGFVRPREVLDVVVRAADGWTGAQQARLAQVSLLGERQRELVKPAHSFAYRWVCEQQGCRGHTQSIADWELGESYRSWRGTEREVIEDVRRKWLGVLCDPKRETLFFVGDQHQHPGGFMVLGVFYPEYRPDRDQLALDLSLA